MENNTRIDRKGLFMDYNSTLKQIDEEYSKKRNLVIDLVESDKFFAARSLVPEMESINSLAKRLKYMDELMVNKTGDPHIKFFSVSEAMVWKDTAARAVDNKYRQQLLNTAVYIRNVIIAIDDYNNFVKNNPILAPKNVAEYALEDKDRLKDVEEDALELISVMRSIVTAPNIEKNYIESCVTSFNEEQLKELIDNKYIAPQVSLMTDKTNPVKEKRMSMVPVFHGLVDLKNDNIPGYNEKMDFVCKQFDITPLTEEYDQRLKGVTQKNEDGSSRQQNIRDLAEEAKKGTKIVLRAEHFFYTPEGGQPENAVKVFWGDKELGVIDKGTIQNAYAKFENPQFTATLTEVTGGGVKNDGTPLSYGLKLKFGIAASQYTKNYLEKQKDEPAKENTVPEAEAEEPSIE